MSRDEREILSEIELAKKQLKEDISKKEKAAEQRLDELLSNKKAKFCSRCGKKVSSRTEWRGHCLHSNCENPICNTCWIIEKSRFCRDHYVDIVGEEKEGKEKIFFRKEPSPLKTLLTQKPEEVDDKIKEKIENLTNTYIDLLKDRLSKSFPDFTPEEFIEKSRAKAVISEEEMNVTVSKKSLLREEAKLRILVRPLYGKEKSDIEFVLNKLKEFVDVYTIIVLVGDEVSREAANFVDKYSNPQVSLLLNLPTQNLLYADSKKLTKAYASIFDKSTNLQSILRSISEDVDGRKVVTAEAVQETFGLREDQTFSFLKTCKFLEFVDDTSSFFFK